MEASSAPQPVAYVVQFLLSNGFVSRSDLKRALKTVNEKFGLENDNKLGLRFVEEKAASYFYAIGMELREVRDDLEEGEQCYVLVDTADFDELENHDLMEYMPSMQLKKLVEILFSDPRCQGTDPSQLSESEFPAKEELLTKLVEDKYVFRSIEEGRHGVLFPGTRMLYSLEPYLAEEYGGKTLFKCLGCHKWLLKGRLCHNQQCPGRLHDRCYDAFFTSQEVQPGICTLCNSEL